MAVSVCEHCGNINYWDWEDAFYKFGFNDGDGKIETSTVAGALERSGYEVKLHIWSIHNTIICSIKLGETEFIGNNDEIELGYDNPRDYLPENIIALLDNEFSET